VLLLGLLLTGGLYAAFSPASAQTDAAAQSTVAKGRELFLVGCASCHGKNGEGIVTKRRQPVRPAAGRRRRRRGRLPGRHRPDADGAPGCPGAEEGGRLHAEEIKALAAYVASLGPGPAIPTKRLQPTTPRPTSTTQAVVRGGQFFRTNCTACHNFEGPVARCPGGKYAPRSSTASPPSTSTRRC
jgi:ubiquinol-cytochrome c reductase cytochrome c subunit